MVKIVTGRTIEAERQQLDIAFRIAQQRDGKAPSDVGGVEKRAIGTIVNVELLAAALFDAHDERAILGRQRATRLAPKLGRIADRQAFEATVNRVEISIERRGLHAGIGGGETAADI